MTFGSQAHSAWEEGEKDFPMVTIASREVYLQQRNTGLRQSWCIASVIGGTLSMGRVNRHDTWFNWFFAWEIGN